MSLRTLSNTIVRLSLILSANVLYVQRVDDSGPQQEKTHVLINFIKMCTSFLRLSLLYMSNQYDVDLIHLQILTGIVMKLYNHC